MKLHASGEDYLEAILILRKKMGMVRSVDLARHMGHAKPSISQAVSNLQKGGFLLKNEDVFLHLTESGQETAEQDACRIEHVISEESFQKLKEAHKNHLNTSANFPCFVYPTPKAKSFVSD